MTETRPAAPKLMRLGVHLGLSNLAHIAIGVTDVAMTGRLGASELAAGALASSLFLVCALTGAGFAAGAGPLLARQRGGGDVAAFNATIWAAVLCLILYAVPVMVLLWFGEVLFLAGGQDHDVSHLAGSYLVWLAATLPFSLAFSVLWTMASATGRGGVVMTVSIAAVGMNALGNYIFMFGAFGMPAMGLAGAGVSTLLTAAVKVLILSVYLKGYRIGYSGLRNAPAHMRPVLQDGIPLAILELATMGYFAAITFLAGIIEPVQLAAHAVAIQTAEIGVGFAFGFSEAAAVSVAFHAGRDDNEALSKTIRHAVGLGAGGMVLYAGVLLLFPDSLTTFFVGSKVGMADSIRAVTTSLLPVAALCLAADCGRIILVGILRGLGDTRRPVAINLAGFWLVALPLAALFGIHVTAGVSGIWFGMATGMGVISVLLAWQLMKRMNRQQTVH